jgi:regulator of protease activity HflC (stomatin/prohibitin superfamily)
MKKLLWAIANLFGLYFAPDNYVIPVLRFGRYRRVGGPGFVWTWPVIEQTLPPLKTSLYVGNFVFEEVLSQDNIPFKVHVTVLFIFDPDSAVKNAAAQLVRAGRSRVVGSDCT